MQLLRLPTVGRLCTVIAIRNGIRSVDTNKISKSLLWSKQKFQEYADKPHRMLVHRLKPRPFLSIPDHVVQSDGSPTYCPQTMSGVFGEYYNKLYNCLNKDSQAQFSKDRLDSSLSFVHLPKLSVDQRSSLNQHLPTYKAPDGLPYSYYRTFLPTLILHLLSLYSSLLKGNIPHFSFLHAFVTVILKLGKDTSIPDNYRPIALLNSDYKFFTKILANTLPVTASTNSQRSGGFRSHETYR